jgi:hypothetical protein
MCRFPDESDALSRRADHGDGSEDNRDLTLLTPNFFAVRALEGLEVVGQERDLLRLIRRETKGEELKDTVKQAVKALKSKCSLHPLFRVDRSRRSVVFPW